jgi:hypothetical protein
VKIPAFFFPRRQDPAQRKSENCYFCCDFGGIPGRTRRPKISIPENCLQEARQALVRAAAGN